MRKDCNRIILIGVLTIIFLLNDPSATIGSFKSINPTGTLAEILNRGYIKVGTDIAYPPFERYNPFTNEVEGFDVDLIHVIVDKLSEEYNT
ncbi:MAG: hypothetical protein ACFFDT_20575, partial [Candidatus Hodarchaeota archaeon]